VCFRSLEWTSRTSSGEHEDHPTSGNRTKTRNVGCRIYCWLCRLVWDLVVNRMHGFGINVWVEEWLMDGGVFVVSCGWIVVDSFEGLIWSCSFLAGIVAIWRVWSNIGILV